MPRGLFYWLIGVHKGADSRERTKKCPSILNMYNIVPDYLTPLPYTTNDGKKHR